MLTDTPSQTPEHNVHPSYRPDIDGLRAVAILSVLVFHAFPSKVKGGFIGVDIFFVISGFLISSIIFRSLQRQDFSFSEFYAHRIRRIFPALIVVLASSFAIGWFTLLPDELKQLGKHMATGAGFIQNFALWREAGYFDSASELKPLMHLWSLAIEEQFYLLYPVLVWAAWRFGWNLLITVSLLGLLSFGANVATIGKDAVGAFFLPQMRFWELVAGGGLAYLLAWHQPRLSACLQASAPRRLAFFPGASLADVLSVIGLLLIVAAVFGINRGKAFPGWWALFPVSGAFLLILSGPQGWANRKLLASRPMVFVGLISYPLYLWHWPLLSFARIGSGELPPVSIRLAAVALSFLLAWLTYRLVERPIRFGTRSALRTLLLCAFLSIAGVVGYFCYRADGLGERFEKLAPEHAEKIGKIAAAWNFREYPTPDASYFDERYRFLAVGEQTGPALLFIGDSHVQQYWHSADAALRRDASGIRRVLFAAQTMPPRIPEEILADTNIRTVVFSYFWAYKYGSAKVDQPMRCCGGGKGGTMGRYDLPLRTEAEMDGFDRDMKAIAESLQKAGKRVFFLLDNPFGAEVDPHAQLTRSIWGDFRAVVPPPLSRASAVDRAEPVRSRILGIAREIGAGVIDPLEYLCDAQNCPVFSGDGELLYKDYDHLSLRASQHHVRYLDPLFVLP